MIIIGVDYHPTFQQIAFLIEETGECGDQRLNHDGGEPWLAWMGEGGRVRSRW
jgi:hypothetical protein